MPHSHEYSYDAPEDVPIQDLGLTISMPASAIGVLVDEVACKLADKAERRFSKAIDQKIEALIAEKLKAGIDAAVNKAISEALDKPLRRTDAFGRSSEGEMSASDIVTQGAKVFLEHLVDQNGKVVAANSYEAQRARKRVEWAACAVIDTKFEAEMKAIIETMKKDLRAGAASRVEAVLREFVARHTPAEAPPV